MKLSNLEPNCVFKFFESVSGIPRGSGNEEAVCGFVEDYFKNKNFTTARDEKNNLVIYKPAHRDSKSGEPLILQAHLDMVCEKNKGTVHDFTRDPIKLRVDGDFISADGTTLGADNGIGVALCLAALDSEEIIHPPLEVLLTADEEAGMSGVEFFDTSLLRGRRMINLDTAKDDTFFAGCAGGARVDLTFRPEWEDAKDGDVFYQIEVKGLRGGHSGVDIEKERGNSLRILARLLRACENISDLRIARVSGGMKLNTIPREAEAVVAFNAQYENKVVGEIKKYTKIFQSEYRASDGGLKIEFRRIENEQKYLSRGGEIISALLVLPNGIQHMHAEIAGLPETSCNVGVIETNDDSVRIQCMPRSSRDSRNGFVIEQIKTIGAVFGMDASVSHGYGAWEYAPDSALRKAASETYEKIFGRPPNVTVVHAGLECGILSDKIKGLDIISFGPNISDCHNPDERLSVSSTARVWKFLCELMRNL